MAQVTERTETALERERRWNEEQRLKAERELLARVLAALENHPDLAADIKIALRGSV